MNVVPSSRRWALASIAGLMFTPLAARAALGSPGAARALPAPARPVLPPWARPAGYSLADMALLTAAFNVGDRSGPPPASPFQLLYENAVTGNRAFEIEPGTLCYVPVVYSDNSEPLLGDFPASVQDRRTLLKYWTSQDEIGMVATDITVDGVTVALGEAYVVGVLPAAALPNGATQYIAAAAFLAPLARGSHVVSIHAKATGGALRRPPFDQVFPDGYFEFTTTYTVNVR